MRKKLSAVHLVWTFLCVGAFLCLEAGSRLQIPPSIQAFVVPTASRVSSFFRDLKFRYRGERAPTQPIVVVDIDDASLEQMGRWPWRRDIIARLIERTFELGASTVGLDIVFSDPQESVPEELRDILVRKKMGRLLAPFDFDSQLGEVFRKNSNRLVASWMSNAVCRPRFSTPAECPVEDPSVLEYIPKDFEKFAISSVKAPQGFRPSYSPLRSAVTVISSLEQIESNTRHAGFVNSLFDADGLIRHVMPVMQVGGKYYPSLALQAAQQIRGDEIELSLDSQGYVSALNWKKSGEAIATTDTGLWEVNYLGPSRRFSYVSARELFLSDVGQTSRALASTLEGRFKGAAVFIGLSALAVGDLVATPLDPVFPGVEVHATVLENILTHSLLNSAGALGIGALVLLMLLASGAVVYWGAKREAVPLLLFVAGVLFLGFVVDFHFLFGANYNLNSGLWYVQVVGSLVITITGRYIIEQNEKKFLRGAFSKYLAPAIVDRLVKDPKQLTLGGHRQNLTVLFSDIRGFTTLSEKLDARVVGEFLNDYLGVQTEILFQFGGTLDKYIGDAIMAFWGAPLSQKDHAARACEAALAMVKSLETHRARYLSQYGIAVDIGIGLTTGDVSVGNMGSSRSFSYTVIGDTVNLASRLEGATKQLGAQVLTSRATLQSIEEAGGQLPSHRTLAGTRVKGKQTAVEIIELLVEPAEKGFLEAFEKGRRLYEARNWTGAVEAFSRAHALKRRDVCCEKYLQLCREFSSSSPGSDWDPAWSLVEK